MRNQLLNIIKKAGFIGTLPARKLSDAISFIGDQSRLNRIGPPLTKRELTIFLTALLPAVGTMWYLYEFTNTPSDAAKMAGIFVLACVLWATEALPLFATALLIIGLQVLLLANPTESPYLGLTNGIELDYTFFLKPLSDPMIILFLGGFILARACVKAGVDGIIASRLLKPFVASPSRMIMGIIIITATFSMWMSNTATTAMMISLLAPVLVQLKDYPKLARGMVLAVPIAANLGGMGTPVASPPNAVAVGQLANIGFKFTFAEWVLAALPVMLFLLFSTWYFIKKQFEAKQVSIQFIIPQTAKSKWANFVMAVFGLTVLLWLSEGIHGVPAPVISMIPLVAFTATGLINREDINSLEWSILLLIAGGIALGLGMTVTGLDKIIVSALKADSFWLVPLMIFGMILLSNFMSNTAAANLIIPIGISMMQLQSFSVLGILAGTVALALASSMAMVLPVSTPPNALAYATGRVEASDFKSIGLKIGGLGLLLLIILYFLAGWGQQIGIFDNEIY
jgi:sodium-dependent dicarboxylate transporter 2/3/5